MTSVLHGDAPAIELPAWMRDIEPTEPAKLEFPVALDPALIEPAAIDLEAAYAALEAAVARSRAARGAA